MPHTATDSRLDDYWATYIEDGRPQGSAIEETLVRAFLPLTLQVVGRLRSRYPSADPDELNSNAHWGLLEAVRTYDPAKGKFEGWAVNTIRNRVLDGQRGSDWISKKRRTNVKAVEAAKAALAQQGIAFPTDTEIARAAHLSVDAVETANSDAVSSKVRSIDEFSDDDGTNAADSTATLTGAPISASDVFSLFDLDEGLAAYFLDAIRMLSDRPKQMLGMYLYGGHDYKEIGQVFSISESRVSQIFKTTAGHLRTNMETLATAH